MRPRPGFTAKLPQFGHICPPSCWGHFRAEAEMAFSVTIKPEQLQILRLRKLMFLKSLFTWSFIDFLCAHRQEHTDLLAKGNKIRNWQSEVERTRTSW